MHRSHNGKMAFFFKLRIFSYNTDNYIELIIIEIICAPNPIFVLRTYLSALFYFNFSPRAPNNPMKASESSTHIYIHVAPGAIHHKNTSRTSRSSSLIQKKKSFRAAPYLTHTHARAVKRVLHLLRSLIDVSGLPSPKHPKIYYFTSPLHRQIHIYTRMEGTTCA